MNRKLSHSVATPSYLPSLPHRLIPVLTHNIPPPPPLLSHLPGLDASKFAAKAATDDLFGDEDWGFTPRSLMDDNERFKDCTKLECICSVCKKTSAFMGLLGGNGTSGLNCPGSNNHIPPNNHPH